MVPSTSILLLSATLILSVSSQSTQELQFSVPKKVGVVYLIELFQPLQNERPSEEDLNNNQIPTEKEYVPALHKFLYALVPPLQSSYDDQVQNTSPLKREIPRRYPALARLRRSPGRYGGGVGCHSCATGGVGYPVHGGGVGHGGGGGGGGGGSWSKSSASSSSGSYGGGYGKGK